MNKVLSFINEVLYSFSDPVAQKYVILFFLSLAVIYNGVILGKFLLKKYGKKISKKKEIDLEPQSIKQKVFTFFKSNTETIIEANIISNVILFFAISIVFVSYTYPMPRVTFPSEPALGVTDISDKQPVVIEFDRPVDTGDLEYGITPEIDGDWKFEKELGIVATKLTFTPKETPKSEERYTVSLENIKGMFGTQSDNYLFSFQTPPAPKVVSVTPGDGDQGVLPGQEITVVTDYYHKDTSELSFEVEPRIELEVTNDDVNYTLKPKDNFKKGVTYNLKIFRKLTKLNYESKEKTDIGEREEIWNGNFITVEAPGVESYSPQGSGVLANSSIKINFKQDMEPTSTEGAFSITPNVQGSFSWEGVRGLIFTPSADLSKATYYAVKISTGAKAADESPFEEEASFSFTTIGYVAVSGYSPTGSSASTSSQVKVTFNQAVDHASAESKFSIAPNVAGSFSWNGNTMIYSHGGLGFSTGYTISVASGVKTVHGLDSNKAYSYSFTTRDQSVMLNVPSYPQSHMYSCMAAAARQALAYRGYYLSENTILSQIGYDTTPFQGTWGDPNAIWGNPNAGVTGNIDGASGGVSWGYGAHAGPTSNAISIYRSNEVKTGWNVQGIAQEIANGNPVIVWWVNGVWPAYTVSWKTPDGTPVSGVNGMHVQVVKGFTGTVDNPTTFTVNDSGYGYPARTFDVGTFKAKWSWFGNTAIIVR